MASTTCFSRPAFALQVHQLSRPRSTLTTRSAMRRVLRRWLTSTTVRPVLSCPSERRMTASFRLSRLLVGSSSSRKGAS